MLKDPLAQHRVLAGEGLPTGKYHGLLKATPRRPWERLALLNGNSELKGVTEPKMRGVSGQAAEERSFITRRLLTLFIQKWGAEGLENIASQRGETDEDVAAPSPPPFSRAHL